MICDFGFWIYDGKVNVLFYVSRITFHLKLKDQTYAALGKYNCCFTRPNC